MAFALQPLANPLHVVLKEEALIGLCTVAIGSRVAPAIENVAPLAVAAARVTLGFLRRGAMVDNPDFREVGTAQDNLVKIGVVIHRVGVHPIRFLSRPILLLLLLGILGLCFFLFVCLRG